MNLIGCMHQNSARIDLLDRASNLTDGAIGGNFVRIIARAWAELLHSTEGLGGKVKLPRDARSEQIRNGPLQVCCMQA